MKLLQNFGDIIEKYIDVKIYLLNIVDAVNYRNKKLNLHSQIHTVFFFF
jgi:hypothetical protein